MYVCWNYDERKREMLKPWPMCGSCNDGEGALVLDDPASSLCAWGMSSKLSIWLKRTGVSKGSLAFIFGSGAAATLYRAPLFPGVRQTVMTATKKYYAVKSGRSPGVYTDWDSCKKQVDGYRGNQYKSFATLAEAEQYLGKSTLSYSVRNKGAKTSVSHAVGKAKNNNRSHKVFGPVKDIQKGGSAAGSSAAKALLTSSPLPDEVVTRTNLGNDTFVSGYVEVTEYSASQIDSERLSTADPDAVYRLEYDGASKGNPGWAGAGALLRRPDGSVLCELTVGLGKTTNNVAEYRGLISGLRKAAELGIQRIQAQGDSKLVTQQLRGAWAVRNENLAVLFKEAKELSKGFKDFQIRHVDREWNSAADALANKGVGLPEEKFVSSFASMNNQVK